MTIGKIRPTRTRAFPLGLAALALASCTELHRQQPEGWFATHNAVMPRAGGRVVVCHGFSCANKTAVRFGAADVARMAKLIGRNSTAAAERAGIARMIAWAERKVAPAAGSAGDVGGLDWWNAGERGQMDCIDEAANTTSYLLIAERAGLLRHHTVGRPVARGFFLDGRYPHATAVVVAGEAAFAVDSWPHANGKRPDIMPLEEWSARSSAR